MPAVCNRDTRFMSLHMLTLICRSYNMRLLQLTQLSQPIDVQLLVAAFVGCFRRHCGRHCWWHCDCCWRHGRQCGFQWSHRSLLSGQGLQVRHLPRSAIGPMSVNSHAARVRSVSVPCAAPLCGTWAAPAHMLNLLNCACHSHRKSPAQVCVLQLS